MDSLTELQMPHQKSTDKSKTQADASKQHTGCTQPLMPSHSFWALHEQARGNVFLQ